MDWKHTIIAIWFFQAYVCLGLAQDKPADNQSNSTIALQDAPRLRIGSSRLSIPTTPDTPTPSPIFPTEPSAPSVPDVGTTQSINLPSGTSTVHENVKPVSPGYVIRTGDQIHFHVLDEDDMDLILRVGKDGTVHIPYINSIVIGGKTINQAIDSITRALRVYYISPIVSLELTEFAQNSFTILGQVNTPGVIALPPQVESIGLMDAIAKANGTNAIADMGNVTVKRMVDGEETVLHVDGRPIARGIPGAHFEVLPGDTIIVALTNNQFKILGDVRNPGIFTLLPLTDSIDLGDALAMAGASSTDLGEITVKRVVGGVESVIELDKPTLRRYSRNEKTGAVFLVLSGDTVEVKVAKVDFVVLGQVRSPGVYQLPAQQDSISILEALAMAGGATRLGDLGHVLVRRKVNGMVENIKVNVKEMQDSDTPQIFQILPEDTISVGERWL